MNKANQRLVQAVKRGIRYISGKVVNINTGKEYTICTHQPTNRKYKCFYFGHHRVPVANLIAYIKFGDKYLHKDNVIAFKDKDSLNTAPNNVMIVPKKDLRRVYG
jgi:hypothetical protein